MVKGWFTAESTGWPAAPPSHRRPWRRRPGWPGALLVAGAVCGLVIGGRLAAGQASAGIRPAAATLSPASSPPGAASAGAPAGQPQGDGGAGLWQIVTALAAAGSLGIATFTMIRTRRAAGAQLLYQLMLRWDDRDMRGRRHRVAAHLLTTPNEIGPETVDILNFLEFVGVAVRRSRVVGKYEAWAGFASFVIPWVAACRDAIHRDYQQDDKTVYADLLAFEDQLARYDARKRGTTVDRVRPRDAGAAFLQDESALRDDSTPVQTSTTIEDLPVVRIELTPARPQRGAAGLGGPLGRFVNSMIRRYHRPGRDQPRS